MPSNATSPGDHVKFAMPTTSATAVAKAKKTKFSTKDVENLASGCQSTDYPFVCDYVKRSVLQMSSLGKTDAEREKLARLQAELEALG